jgi:hypothetical protein
MWFDQPPLFCSTAPECQLVEIVNGYAEPRIDRFACIGRCAQGNDVA